MHTAWPVELGVGGGIFLADTNQGGQIQPLYLCLQQYSLLKGIYNYFWKMIYSMHAIITHPSLKTALEY